MAYFYKDTFTKKINCKNLKNCDKNIRMKMTNNDNDNDSSNVNETIKKFYFFFYEKCLQVQSSIVNWGN